MNFPPLPFLDSQQQQSGCSLDGLNCGNIPEGTDSALVDEVELVVVVVVEGVADDQQDQIECLLLELLCAGLD